jgi:predicted HTH domain antitoxin
MAEVFSLLDDLDVLVERGIYRDREALMKDAVQSLLRSKPELRRQLAIELYKLNRISLSRAAEIGGVDVESFKEILRETGVTRVVSPVGETVRDEVERLMHLRETE